MKVQRLLAATALGVLLVAAGVGPGALAAAQHRATLADSFETSSYDGNDGTMRFRGPWSEIGENDGPKSGDVRIVKTGGCESGLCLEINGTSEVLGVRRGADLSGATGAVLSFALSQKGGPADGDLAVRVSSDGGRTWTTLVGYPRHTHPATHSLDITPWTSQRTVIAFVATPDMRHTADLDDVRIDVTYEGPPQDPDPPDTGSGPPDHADPQGKPHVTPTTAAPPQGQDAGTTGAEISGDGPADTPSTTATGRLNDDVLIGIAMSHRSFAPPAWTATERSLVRSSIRAADISRALAGSRELRRDREPITDVSAMFTRTGPSLGSQLIPAALLGVLIAWATITGFERKNPQSRVDKPDDL